MKALSLLSFLFSFQILIGADVGQRITFVIPAPSIEEQTREFTLRAIVDVEADDGRLGPARERGPFRFRPQTWGRYSSLPHHYAHNSYVAWETARVAYQDLAAILARRGLPVDPYHIALYWNGGPTRTRFPSRVRDYATRVQNLASDLARDGSARHSPVYAEAPMWTSSNLITAHIR